MGKPTWASPKGVGDGVVGDGVGVGVVLRYLFERLRGEKKFFSQFEKKSITIVANFSPLDVVTYSDCILTIIGP